MVHHALVAALPESRYISIIRDMTDIIALLFVLYLLLHYYFNYFLLFSMNSKYKIHHYFLLFKCFTYTYQYTYYVNYIHCDNYSGNQLIQLVLLAVF